MAGNSSWVVNLTEATFQQVVLEGSQNTLVVLDFWAPWCNPCRQLAPILEKLAEEYAGKFILAKINTDEEPQIAAAFGIQSIPLVVAFKDGQPIDQFQGIMPETEIRQWVDRLLPSPADQLLQAGRQLEETDPKAAESKYREAQLLAPEMEELRIRLAKVLLAQGRLEECRTLIEELESRGFLEPEAERLKSELEVRESAAESGGVEEARLAAENAPDDLSLQIRYADALAVASQHRKALEILLSLVQKDRSGETGRDAKANMVKIFDMLGPASELTSEYRRKLATALY